MSNIEPPGDHGSTRRLLSRTRQSLWSPRRVWLVGLANVSALWHVPPNSPLKDSFADVSSIAIVGFPIHSTFTTDVAAVPSSSAPSPVSSRLSVPASAKPGNNLPSPDCYFASVWIPEHPRTPSLPQKTSRPIRSDPMMN